MRKSPSPRSRLVCVYVFGAIFIAPALIPAIALANEENNWNFSVEAGSEYASNLSVEEIDLDLGSSDIAATLEMSAGYDWQASANTRLSVTYDFSQSIQSEHSEFDLQAHILSTSAEFELAQFILTPSYSYVDVLLGNDAFMDMQIFRQSIASLVSSHLYVDGSYSYMTKRFDTLPTRDADTNVVALDTYYFYNQSKSYVVGGIRHEDEEAVGPLYDYQAMVGHLDMQVPVSWLGDESRFKVGAKYTERDYDEAILALGGARADTYYQFGASLSIPFRNQYKIIADYDYTDRRSNMPSADYTENTVALSLRFTF